MISLIRMSAAGTLAAFALSASPLDAQLPRWNAGSQSLGEFDITRDTSVVHTGHASIRVHADEEPTAFVSIATAFAAERYHGRHVRYSVFLRSESLRGLGGQLWARADDANNRSVAFINSVQLTSFRGTNDWTQLSVSLDVPNEAARVFFGVISPSAGTLWIDDARIEADGVAPLEFGFETLAEFTPPPKMARPVITREAPRALTARGLANLSAFTTALGYVRFFYPTARAVNTNWDELAVHGVRAVEKAPTTDSLAATLTAIFSSIGPDLRFAKSESALPSLISKPADATHAVFWRHLGVGAPSGGMPPNQQNIYRSERLAVPLSSVGQPVDAPAGIRDVVSLPKVPDPAKPLHVSLDGGVVMSIPTALFTSETVIPDGLRSPSPVRATELLVAGDRATRIASVALAWSLFGHFYPYFGVVHTDWLSARTSALQAAATDPDAASFQVTLARLVAKLHDGHGNVYRSGGSPVSVPDVRLGWAEGRVFVTAVGDSATANGVHIGDEVLTVDGRPIRAVMDAQREQTSGATDQWIRSRVLGSLLMGEAESAVALRLADANGKTRDVTLRRARTTVNDRSLDKIAQVGPGAIYVDLGRITDADFTEALPKLEAARSIIFDMRGYPRANTVMIFAHLTDSVIHSAHFKVPVITEPRYKNVGFIDGAWTIQPIAPRIKARIVFLSGGGAISYAESTLGVVEAYKLGDIVGEPSAGTNGNVNPFVLPGGFNVTWTGMLVEKRDGTPHHGVGVVPTIRVSPTIAGMRAGKDDVLERAIALVSPRPLTP